jgi:Hsp90 protein
MSVTTSPVLRFSAYRVYISHPVRPRALERSGVARLARAARCSSNSRAWLWALMHARLACRVTLFLKEDAEDLLEENELNRLIRTYSEFISFPINLWTTKQESKQVEDVEATKKAQEEAAAKAKEEGKVRTACRRRRRPAWNLRTCMPHPACECLQSHAARALHRWTGRALAACSR